MGTPLPTTTVILAANLASGLFVVTAIVTLVVLLITRELGSAEIGRERRRSGFRFLVTTLNAPILSLLAVFIVIVAVRVSELV